MLHSVTYRGGRYLADMKIYEGSQMTGQMNTHGEVPRTERFLKKIKK